MYNFFTDQKPISGLYTVYGNDFNHIKNVLRMKEKDLLLISDGTQSNLCEIESFGDEFVRVKIVEENYNRTNLPIDIYLFQGLPKSDKMELIIQKAVELGVHTIIPVQMKRCVAKLDKPDAKTKRWQAISESAGKQSKRNFIPQVLDAVDFKKATEEISRLDLALVPYENENGIESTVNALKKLKAGMKVGLFIGPEGGFDQAEISLLKEHGANTISLGKRILRTETATLTALSMLMLYSEIKL